MGPVWRRAVWQPSGPMGLEPGDGAPSRGGQGAEVFRLAGSARILRWAPFVLTVVGPSAPLVAALGAADDRTGAGVVFGSS